MENEHPTYDVVPENLFPQGLQAVETINVLHIDDLGEDESTVEPGEVDYNSENVLN